LPLAALELLLLIYEHRFDVLLSKERDRESDGTEARIEYQPHLLSFVVVGDRLVVAPQASQYIGTIA
jgi:hypothetical protein